MIGPIRLRRKAPDSNRFATIILLAFVIVALAPSWSAWAGPKAASTPEQRVESMVLVDNDVYLFTPELWGMTQRLARGELFDTDAELEAHIKKRPNVFSAYFMLGLLKVRRYFINPTEHLEDKAIIGNFSLCLQKARKAQKLQRYRDAGLFYETVCEAGFAFYDGLSGNYMKAHHHIRNGVEALDKTLKRRPRLHGALLLQGIYNYFTGRFGFITKLILRLIGLPPGETSKGIRQIKESAATPSPIWYFANIYAIYSFSPRKSLKPIALKKAHNLVRTYPSNYYAYLLRAYVQLKRGNYHSALADNIKGRKLAPANPGKYGDLGLIADVFLLDVRIAYLKALLRYDDKGLAFLDTWAKKRKVRYLEAPLVALVYLGHLYSFAHLDGKALGFYGKMQDFEDVNWMRDLGKRYEKRPMRKRRRISENHSEKLRKWLSRHPEVKP